jgi:hypothetical protein
MGLRIALTCCTDLCNGSVVLQQSSSLIARTIAQKLGILNNSFVLFAVLKKAATRTSVAALHNRQ